MKISIIVAHYKEPWSVVEPLFNSIKEQLGIDFNEVEVILVHDGTEKIQYLEKYHSEFPFKITQEVIEHKGVSAVRNRGLDLATGEYVMFCDCDDRFIHHFALHTFVCSFGKAEIIKTPFLEDQVVNGEFKIIRHDNDVSFVHGKMYRRQFLVDNNIRFDESLTIHEDGYFNVVAQTVAQNNIHEMSPSLYLWKWNDNSVVRQGHNNLFLYKTYDHLMKCRRRILEELWERGYVNEYFQALAKTVLDAYYDFQKPDALQPENKELIEKAEKEFANLYKDIRDDYNDIGINDIAQMMFLCRTIAFQNNMRVEQETVSQFLTRIVKKYLT